MIITDFINDILQKFDLVLLFTNESDADESFTKRFLNSEALQKTKKKILVLSSQNISCTNLHNQYYQLNVEELDALQRIYYMYEFSDRFQILSYNPQYGSLLNYVKSGDMTMEAVFQSLLEV